MILLVPSLCLDISLLETMLSSIDHPIKVCIVVNRHGAHLPNGMWKNFHADWYGGVENLGVARSWNYAPHAYPDENAWIIVNEDVQFEPGALVEFLRKVEELADKESFIMWNEAEGFCCFAWTRVGVERFGLFDENFYPAYEEDWDMKMRWSAAGYRPPNVFGKSLPLKHGKPVGGPRYNKMIQGGAALRQGYFIRKWGKLDYKDPPYKTPFNDPSKSIKDWTIEPVMRANLQKTWDDFISQPNPSIYA